VCDLCGNAWEWVWDWYDNYPGDGHAETDPKGPSQSQYGHARRGGAWKSTGGFGAMERGASRPSDFDTMGARCCKD
jgi:formylglycine-generating enzyme required for sulfatase activity